MFTAEGFKFPTVFFGNLVNGFEAISYESRAEYQQAFLTFFGHLCNHFAGVGLYPWVAAKARLETNGVFLLRDAECCGNEFSGMIRLCRVAKFVGIVKRLATVFY